MASIPIEDINYLVEQSNGKINMILSGMIALMNDTDNKVETMESQGWFKRMIKTVCGKNKLTKDEIRKNNDKLNAYMSQAIAELYNRNCIDEKVMMSLGTQLNELYADHIQLKQMLGSFVSKLNEKIDSVDNFHMLTTEINQGVYSFDTPIFSICKIISQFDKRILEDSRKLYILRRSMVSQNIINDEQIILTDYLNHILQIPVEEIGQIYLELGTIKDNFMSKIILDMIDEYHFLPDMDRKIKNKDILIEEVINNEKLDATVKLSISDIYNDFINSKIKVAGTRDKNNIEKFKKKSEPTNKAMDTLGELELKILNGFEDFFNTIEKIQNRPQFEEYSKDGVILPKYDEKELKKASIGAGVILGGLTYAGRWTASGFAAFGAAATNPALATLGVNCSSELESIAIEYTDSLTNVYKQYLERFNYISYQVNKLNRVDWNEFKKYEKNMMENCVLLAGLLYEMCQVNLVSKSENYINTVNRSCIDASIKNAERVLSGIKK